VSGVISPLPHYAFMVWCLVKHRDNFTFYLYLKVIGCEGVDWMEVSGQLHGLEALPPEKEPLVPIG
jgi:hypothetical protein